MKEYNKLTQKLLSEGYTAENHPKEVYLENSFNKDDPYDTFHGGFQYIYYYAAQKTYKTACGMLCKGSFTHSNLSWMGVMWTHENNCPTIRCPKGCVDCQIREEPFRSEHEGALCEWCAVHETDEEYAYEGSCEAELKLYDDRIRREMVSFKLKKNNRVCDNHCFYNKEKAEWEFDYDPMQCANGFCRAQQSDFEDGGFCPVLGKAISKEKGNVFYDLRCWGRDYSKDGTLFEGDTFERITKGIQVFKQPIRLDIAKVIANLCKDNIKQRAEWYLDKEYAPLTIYKAKLGEIDFHWEILNVRAEKKATRDFEQDLRDIESGINVVHHIDKQKAKAAQKSAKRQEAKDKRIQKIKDKIVKEGFGNLEYIDQNRAYKLLSYEEIEVLDYEHEHQEAKPEQMSIFDYMEA